MPDGQVVLYLSSYDFSLLECKNIGVNSIAEVAMLVANSVGLVDFINDVIEL